MIAWNLASAGIYFIVVCSAAHFAWLIKKKPVWLWQYTTLHKGRVSSLATQWLSQNPTSPVFTSNSNKRWEMTPSFMFVHCLSNPWGKGIWLEFYLRICLCCKVHTYAVHCQSQFILCREIISLCCWNYTKYINNECLTFFDKGPELLLWAGSPATHVRITHGTHNHQNYCAFS